MRKTVKMQNIKSKIQKILKLLGSVNPRKSINFSRTENLCQTTKFFQNTEKVNFKNLSKLILFQEATKLPHNVGSYTQVRTAGDFLSSRKAAWAERCPPKTTAAALDG